MYEGANSTEVLMETGIVQICNLVIGSQQILVDVTIRNPTSPTYYECRGGSAEQQLRSTVIAEQQKTAKYSTMAKAQGAKFLPFAVEMYGGMGKSAKQLL